MCKGRLGEGVADARIGSMPTLDWIGKKAVVNHHREVPYNLLRCDNSLSSGGQASGKTMVMVMLKSRSEYN